MCSYLWWLREKYPQASDCRRVADRAPAAVAEIQPGLPGHRWGGKDPKTGPLLGDRGLLTATWA